MECGPTGKAVSDKPASDKLPVVSGSRAAACGNLTLLVLDTEPAASDIRAAACGIQATRSAADTHAAVCADTAAAAAMADNLLGYGTGVWRTASDKCAPLPDT